MSSSSDDPLQFLSQHISKYEMMATAVAGTSASLRKKPSNPSDEPADIKMERRLRALLGIATPPATTNGPQTPTITSASSDNQSPGIQCLRELFTNIKVLTDQLEAHPSALTPILRILSGGLEGSPMAVCQWICRILSRIIFNMNDAENGAAVTVDAYRWFVGKTGSVDLVLQCYLTHPKLHHSVFTVLEQFSRPDLNHFMNTFLMEQIPDQGQYFMFVHEFLEFMCLSTTSKKAMMDSGLPRFLVQFTSNAVGDRSASADLRLAGYMLIAFLYSSFPAMEDATVQTILSALKKGCHDRLVPIRVNCFACLSVILEDMLDHHPAMATDLYKFQVFVMIEFHTDPMKSYFQKRLLHFLDHHPKIPVNLVVEPFLKTLLVHKYDNLDFDVLLSLAKHPTLDVLQASRLFTFVWTVATTDLVFTRAATICMLIVVHRFYRRLLSDLDRYVESAIASSITAITESPQGEMSMDQDARVRMAAEVILAIIELRHDEINQIIREWSSRIPADVKHPALQSIMECLDAQ